MKDVQKVLDEHNIPMELKKISEPPTIIDPDMYVALHNVVAELRANITQ